MKRKSPFNISTRLALICITLQISGFADTFAQTSLTLDQALEISMKNSPDIRRTELDLERSRELLKAQKASLKSNFRLTFNPFSYSRDRTFNTGLSEWISNETKSSRSTFSITQPIARTDGTLSLNNRFSWQDSYSDYKGIRDETFSNNLFLSFTQPIFTYNRTTMELRELELSLEQTLHSFALQKLNLERQVTQSYFNVYQSQMNLDISTEELKNQEQSYIIIKNKVDAGLAAREELYQGELNLASSKSSLQNRQVSLENTLDNFKQLIGIPISDNLSVEADVEYRQVDVNLDKALATALKNRMELRQLEINLETAEFNLIQTASQNEFKGDITLSYGLIGNEEKVSNIFDAPTKQQAIGLSFDIPLWDWGEKKARIKASKASIERQKLSFADERISITLSIRQVHRNLGNLINQIDIARQNIRNAEMTYDINLERYKNGDLTSMDLNLYQTQLSQVKMGLVNALIDYKLALLDMKIQSLWDFEKDEPVLPESLY